MAEEIAEAVQIIRVAYDGIEIAMKVGSGGIKSMQKALSFLKGMLDYEKTLGKTSMRKLLQRGGDLQVFQFDVKDMKQVEKRLAKYGVLYSVLPDLGRTDGLREIIFHSEAAPRVNLIAQRISHSRLTTIDEYLKDGDKEQLSKLMKFLENQKEATPISSEEKRVNENLDGLIEKVGLFASGKQSISVEQVKENFSIDNTEAENVIKQLETIGFLGKKDESGMHKVMMDKDAFINRVRGYQELADRMRVIAASKDSSLSDVTISKTLIKDENDHAVKTRIPGTYGDNARYIWLKKENIMEIHNGKTMLTFLDTRKDYKIYDEDNRVVETKTGENLYSHYDRVESSVRERYEKVKAQQTKAPSQKPKRR